MAHKRKTRQQRHTFTFKAEPGGQIFKARAVVKIPRYDVDLPLKAEHVRESIKLEGVGNTAKCSMAVCARREAHRFPHKVEGYVDWYYRRAFVVSRCSKDNGMPSECYVYSHSDGIGKLNDSKNGQHRLLAQLEAEGGERIIHLRVPGPSTGKNKKKGMLGSKRLDGSRSKIQPRGAKLRFAVAQMGAVA